VTRLTGRLIVFLVFTVSRLAIVASDQRESTLAAVNLRYAFEAQRAASRGMSIYKLHAESRQLESAAIPPVERVVEYPPLTILWMKAPAWFLDPIPKTGPAPGPWVRAAKWANQIAMFVVDLCGFGILALIGATGAQLAVYTAGGLLLFPVLYDRFDLLLGVLLLGAMVLLVRKRPSWAPLTVLMVAINLKITPLVLVPLFVLGTLPENALPSPSGTRPWGLIGRRLAMLSALGAALFLPFFVKDGFSTLDFLRYHAMRGLEVSSVWNTIPIALSAIFQWPANPSFRFGSFELKSALGGLLRTMASAYMAAVIPVLAFLLWRLLRKLGTPAKLGGTTTLAQANPALFLRCAVVCLLTAIIGAHVLSPQYLLWLVPLVVLWEGRWQWCVWAVFLVMCALTTLSYPYLWNILIFVLQPDSRLPLWARLLWSAPLIARNLLLVGFTAWLWIEMFRKPASGMAGVEQLNDPEMGRPF
jgi:hypothetical protein